MRLILHIPQLQYHLQSELLFFNEKVPFHQVLERCARLMTHDAQRNAYYLKDLILCQMVFQAVAIYYTRNQIIFFYNTSCTDISEMISSRLDHLNIPFKPIQKSFLLR